MGYEGDDDTNINWCAWNSPQTLGYVTGKVGNWGRIDTIQRLSVNAGVKNLQGVK